MKLTFITGNKNKLKEIQDILGSGIDIENKDIDLPEIQEIDGVVVVTEKSKVAFDLIKNPLIVEDTSLYINAWNGLPGPLYKWFEKTTGNEGILKMLSTFEDRSCYAQTVIAYNDGSNIKVFEGIVRGKVSDSIKGQNGFGWDKIIIPDGYSKTYAQMIQEEKNRISSRKMAIENLKKYLESK